MFNRYNNVIIYGYVYYILNLTNILAHVVLSAIWFHQKKFRIYVHYYMLMILSEDYGSQEMALVIHIKSVEL